MQVWLCGGGWSLSCVVYWQSRTYSLSSRQTTASAEEVRSHRLPVWPWSWSAGVFTYRTSLSPVKTREWSVSIIFSPSHWPAGTTSPVLWRVDQVFLTADQFLCPKPEDIILMLNKEMLVPDLCVESVTIQPIKRRRSFSVLSSNSSSERMMGARMLSAGVGWSVIIPLVTSAVSLRPGSSFPVLSITQQEA